MTPDEAALERAWNLAAPAGYLQSFNLAPSQLAPAIVRGEDGSSRLTQFKWGFQPHWAKRAWINARCETVFESRAFASAARHRRCLLPAVGWYEWQGDKPPRQPWLFHLDGFTPFAFAGIWEQDGTDGTASFAILTTAAATAIAGIHGRMPLVVADRDHERWLADDCDRAEAEAIIGNNRTDVAFYKVSAHVNKPENNDAACIRPLE